MTRCESGGRTYRYARWGEPSDEASPVPWAPGAVAGHQGPAPRAERLQRSGGLLALIVLMGPPGVTLGDEDEGTLAALARQVALVLADIRFGAAPEAPPADAERRADELSEARARKAAKASEALAGPRPAAPGEAEAARLFRREADYWTIAYGRDSFRLKHSKGLGYLAELLAHPGVELHALALAAATDGCGYPVAAERLRRSADDGLESSGVGDAGELLDREATDAYRRRIEELSAELDEAERFGDPERLARARAESQFLTDELAAAVGLGGRGRRAPGPAERARQSVTKAIKAALRRIEEQSPALARHLAATVRTGANCAYEPDPRVPIDWRR
jgi:hypothetical protein